MSPLPVDVTFALQEAGQKDAVQKKLEMDALRGRLSDGKSKQEKLRETCEGFESIFIQKMWEQMRKTVPKEGYLHSKDEETYQSLFDVELSKKMSASGGIGLADMLYEQLSQQLENKSRSTIPGAYRMPLVSDPSSAQAAAAAVTPPAEKMTEDELYTPLEEAKDKEQQERDQGDAQNALLEALRSIREDLGLPPSDADAEAEAKVAATPAGGLRETAEQSRLTPSSVAMQGPSAATPQPDAVAAGQERAGAATSPEENAGILSTSWQRSGQVSVTPRPVSLFGRNKTGRSGKSRQAQKANAAQAEARPQPLPGKAPSESVWPHDGKVVNGFGWENDPSTGKRRWNPGVSMSASAGDPVRAALDGTVIFAGPREGYGNTVVLEHADGFLSYYGNVLTDSLRVGDHIPGGTNFARVSAQDLPGREGENSSLLHFEFKRGEMALNPENAIPRTPAAKG